MKSRTHPHFRKAYAKLPKDIREQARKAYKQFKADPYHNSLHFKQVHSTDPIFSVRVGIHYRALGVKHGDTIVWSWIGHHSEYDKMLAQF